MFAPFLRLALASAAAVAMPATAAMTAITGATVIDVDTGRATPDAVILIDGARIAAVGPAASVAVPAGARVIAMPGKWLIPGLMNMHVHLGLKLPGAAGAELLTETDSAETLRMASNARLSLLSGVTTVRLVGEDHGTDFALKAAIDRGEVPGPRIQTAGEVIVPTGGHGSMEADGPYALAKAVRNEIKQGATWIKIAISGGISDTHGAIGAAQMTDEEMKITIEAAHRNNVKVTAHNGSAVAADQALRFGIDGFEHGYHLSEANLKTMKAKGVWLVPTIVVSEKGAMEFYKKIGSPQWYLDRVTSTGIDHMAMLRTAVRLGVNIALGTDQHPFEPNSGTTATVHEAEVYVQAGMTPLQALQSATTESARMLGQEAEVGRLKPGLYADIVALDADPVKDVRALRTINFVIKGGEVVRNDAVAQ